MPVNQNAVVATKMKNDPLDAELCTPLASMQIKPKIFNICNKRNQTIQ